MHHPGETLELLVKIPSHSQQSSKCQVLFAIGTVMGISCEGGCAKGSF